jgi:hypothetical protein
MEKLHFLDFGLFDITKYGSENNKKNFKLKKEF